MSQASTQIARCPRCGGSPRWIAERARWGCDRCQQFIDDLPAAGGPPPGAGSATPPPVAAPTSPRCPQCGGPAEWLAASNAWGCPNCRMLLPMPAPVRSKKAFIIAAIAAVAIIIVVVVAVTAGGGDGKYKPDRKSERGSYCHDLQFKFVPDLDDRDDELRKRQQDARNQIFNQCNNRGLSEAELDTWEACFKRAYTIDSVENCLSR